MADRTSTITLAVRDAYSVNVQAFAKALKQAGDETTKLSTGMKLLQGATAGAKDFMMGMGIALPINPMMALGEAVKFSIDAATQAQDVFAQTEAGVKSTGGAAGYTAQQLADLAKSFQKTTTFEDETILSAENLLITFDKIRGPIFKDATQAVLDLSTRMGGDLKGAAIQVGKALQDPAVGLTALRRVGVSFNEEQVKVIKNLFDTGHVAEAQRMILGELAKEFGGSATAAAQTFGGTMQQTQNNIQDLGEEIGGFLIKQLGYLADDFRVVKETAKTAADAFDIGKTHLADMRQEVLLGTVSLDDYKQEVLRLRQLYGEDLVGPTRLGLVDYDTEVERAILLTKAQAVAVTDASDRTRAAAQSMRDLDSASKGLATALEGTDTAASALAGTQDLLAAGTKQLTQEFIYQEAAQGLDAKSALELGLQMGVLNNQTVDTAQKIQDLKDKYDINRDGVIDATEATSGYTAEVRNLANAIKSLKDKTVHVTVIHDEKIGGSSPLPGGAASGADFYAPPGYPNDSYPVYVTSGEHVKVTPVGGEVKNTTNNTSNDNRNQSKVTINVYTSQPVTPQNLALMRAQAGAY